MLFRKKIERSCAYCIHGAKLGDGMVLCSKRGQKTEENSCRKFRYDPCKRVPHKQKPIAFSKFEDSDFSLGE